MKTLNSYAKAFSQDFYEKTPKAVFAALAASYLINLLEVVDEPLDRAARNEWETLHMQGIVPQKPPKEKR